MDKIISYWPSTNVDGSQNEYQIFGAQASQEERHWYSVIIPGIFAAGALDFADDLWVSKRSAPESDHHTR